MLLGACNQKKSSEEFNDYPVKPVEFTKVHFTDDFWLPRLDTNRKVTIPYDFNKCEKTHRIANFAVAGGLQEGKFVGRRYNDSDVFKVIEGASYSLHNHPDPELEKYLDDLISKIAAAQEEDGYLFTCRTINPDSVPKRAGEERWSYLKSSHELYNVGHMYEAAVAHYRATGKKTFLNVAIKNANLICETFGPGKDQLHGVPGHQEIEIGLVKLYRVTGEPKYLEMAKYFLDQRGNAQNRELYTYGENGENKVYTQDHKPVTEQTEALGHAVRAGYMYSGMADVAALTDDIEYLNAIDQLWQNVTYKKLYITGGIGAKHAGEAFDENYVLPNLSAYCETCAAIANMLWNQRLFLLHGDAKYVDVLERTLYNNFLAGVSIHGDKFFYPNPLESDGSHKRSPWFDCACCPTNVVRFMPSLPGYVYARKNNELYVNLFIGGEAQIDMDFGKVDLLQETSYPWEGKTQLTLQPEKETKFTVKIRIPGWARNEAVPGDLYHFAERSEEKPIFLINGEEINPPVKNGYATIHRSWKNKDEVSVQFPMPVRKILANKNVDANRGKFAIQKGPLVYAAEGVDNNGKVRNLLMDMGATFTEKHREELVDGITILKSKASSLQKEKNGKLVITEKDLTLIPYYAWNHRGPSEMVVWFPYQKSAASPTPPATIASESTVTASYTHDAIQALNDQVIPESSNDHSIPRFTFWDHKGTKEWVMYKFQKPHTISKTDIYWFDDTPAGGCKVPESWNIYYHDMSNGEWKKVDKHEGCPVNCNQFNTVSFVPVKTDALKLVVQLRDGYSGGILEWKVQ
jgi:hypothetical protein